MPSETARAERAGCRLLWQEIDRCAGVTGAGNKPNEQRNKNRSPIYIDLLNLTAIEVKRSNAIHFCFWGSPVLPGTVPYSLKKIEPVARYVDLLHPTTGSPDFLPLWGLQPRCH